MSFFFFFLSTKDMSFSHTYFSYWKEKKLLYKSKIYNFTISCLAFLSLLALSIFIIIIYQYLFDVLGVGEDFVLVIVELLFLLTYCNSNEAITSVYIYIYIWAVDRAERKICLSLCKIQCSMN